MCVLTLFFAWRGEKKKPTSQFNVKEVQGFFLPPQSRYVFSLRSLHSPGRPFLLPNSFMLPFLSLTSNSVIRCISILFTQSEWERTIGK